MSYPIHHPRRYALIGACCLTLAGCKEVLFSELGETEANEMVAVLAAAGVEASRARDKDNVYSISVEADSVATATTLLRQQGYPRPKFETLGDVFGAEGIVGTPFEQHVRYIHAMNEELSRTVTAISGVQSARVFITAPPKDRYAREAPPASASITINYEADFDAEASVSKIKTVVAHSVPNLDYDDVAVALFSGSGPAVQVSKPAQTQDRVVEAGVLPSVKMTPSDQDTSWLLPLIGTLSIALAVLMLLLRRAGISFGAQPSMQPGHQEAK